MNAAGMVRAIWAAGAVHLGIAAANIPLPGRLRVRERLAGVPRFVRQIFYVHWSRLGRFLSAFIAGFWLFRIVLQVFYYDREVRRENRGLDLLYLGALVVLVGVFGMAAV